METNKAKRKFVRSASPPEDGDSVSVTRLVMFRLSAGKEGKPRILANLKIPRHYAGAQPINGSGKPVVWA